MKYIKIDGDHEITYSQPLVVNDRLYFTDDPTILAEHGYYPLVEAEYPETRVGYRIVRRVEFDTNHYNEIYEYVPVSPDDEVTGDELLAELEGIL